VANRWWIPAGAAAAVVLIAAGTALALRGDVEPPASAPALAPASGAASPLDQLRVRNGDTVTASGTVVASPGRPVRFCAPVPVAAVGTFGPEQPPACSLGVDLVGADTGRLTGPKAFRDTRWGQAAITGRYADGTITVTAQGAPVARPDRALDLPERPPCPAPTGGWQPGPADRAGIDALTAVVTRRPAAYGEVVMTYPDGRPSGPEAATEVLMVTTTLPLATGEKELRARFAGNLCVRPAARSRSATGAVWTRIQADTTTWQRYGVFEGGPDYLAGRARVALVVLDDAAYGWLTDAAAGSPAIDADPWLRPAD